MCVNTTWHYTCGCPAPKAPTSTHTSHHLQEPCKVLKYDISYLQFACSSTCGFDYDPVSSPDLNENHIYHGYFQGEKSAEDHFFGRNMDPVGCRSENDLRVPRWRDEGRRIVVPSFTGWAWELRPGMGLGSDGDSAKEVEKVLEGVDRLDGQVEGESEVVVESEEEKNWGAPMKGSKRKN